MNKIKLLKPIISLLLIGVLLYSQSVYSLAITKVENDRRIELVRQGSDRIFWTYCDYWTKEQNDRFGELLDQGYNWEVASDQAEEEIRGRDGAQGTGGIDGKLLDGTPAPRASGSSSGGTTTTKPSCSHEWESEVTKEASCVEEGLITKTCSKCGKTKTETVAKTVHDYALTSTTEATCQVPAQETYTCSVCGDTYTVEGAYGEHIYVKSDESVEATCTKEGLLVKVCSVCGDRTEEVIPALGHNYTNIEVILKEATCTEDGVKAFVCVRCDEPKEEIIIPAKGHTDTIATDKKANFFFDGKEVHTCSVCGEILSETVIPATGGVWRYIIPIVGGAVLSGLVVFLIVKARKKTK